MTRGFLALCGFLEAIYALANFRMLRDAPVPITGVLALVAGLITIAAGAWGHGSPRSSLLALNGAALSAYGALTFFSHHRISYVVFGTQLAFMAMSLGRIIFSVSQDPHRQVVDRLLAGLAAAGSVAFVAIFFLIGVGGIDIGPPNSVFPWLGAYFAFGAACKLAIGLRWGLPGRSGDISVGALPRTSPS